MDINMMSNAEIKVAMKELEFEYEALKTKIKKIIDRMDEIDEKYISYSNLLNKRSKGNI
jgi:hypothetical protein